MQQYPDVEQQPATEDWHEHEKWSFQKVFTDLGQWEYDDASKAAEYKTHWEALRAWHAAYS
eukprot:1743047-Pleurochrysis_carterae.AAC.1